MIISIVMPAYNAGCYISDAIQSVLDQKYQSWELIVVDDCSKDNTCETVDGFVRRDKRITLIRRKTNSGSARQPRFDAIRASKGDWIMTLDADDYIEPNYLNKVVDAQKNTLCDVVISQMILIDEKDFIINTIPYDGLCRVMEVFDGKKAFSMTIGGWQIGFNGSVSRKALYSQFLEDKRDEMNLDEVDSRIILATANLICYSGAKYYYRRYPGSITQRNTVKKLDIVKTNMILLFFIGRQYGKNDSLYLTQLEISINSFCTGFRYCLDYGRSFTSAEREKAMALLRKVYWELYDERKMVRNKRLFFCGFYPYIVFATLKYCFIQIYHLVRKKNG